LGLAFFGLTSDNFQLVGEIKASIYRQIHLICFHGQGGYSWPIVYDMPLYLRRFIFNEIKTYHEEQNEQTNKQSSSSNTKVINPSLRLNTPPSNPSTTKSPSKKEVKIPIQVQYK